MRTEEEPSVDDKVNLIEELSDRCIWQGDAQVHSEASVESMLQIGALWSAVYSGVCQLIRNRRDTPQPNVLNVWLTSAAPIRYFWAYFAPSLGLSEADHQGVKEREF